MRTSFSTRRRILAALLPAAAAVLAIGGPSAAAQGPGRTVKPVRADLADLAAGRYFGDVISDARGSSRSDVRITVTKIGPNKVQIASDYPRLPSFTASSLPSAIRP